MRVRNSTGLKDASLLQGLQCTILIDGLQRACRNTYSHIPLLFRDVDLLLLKIRKLTAFAAVVCVGYVVPYKRLLACNLTFASHDIFPSLFVRVELLQAFAYIGKDCHIPCALHCFHNAALVLC